MTGLDQIGLPDLRSGPVLVAAPPGDAGPIEALLVRATLAAGHRRVQAARVLNGWVIAAFDD
ncbi:MAG TPA: hypothetical protein VKG45_04245 [Actinomycetes bacterium]|nr:hypothetical protein [Actinomycetes bacterium]